MSNLVTVLLLNWKRPDNLRLILDALAGQSVKPEIFLWNNYPAQPIEHKGITQQITSGTNQYCSPRWTMALQAQTTYIMTCDDDLMPSDKHLIQDVIETDKSSVGDPYRIIGAFGKVLVPGVGYEQCTAAYYDQPCDIVLGRMMFMKTAMLQKRLLRQPVSNCDTTDDIAVSGIMARGQTRVHLRSGIFRGRLIELPDNDAICKEPGHFARREEARRRWLSL